MCVFIYKGASCNLQPGRCLMCLYHDDSIYNCLNSHIQEGHKTYMHCHLFTLVIL